MLSKKENANTIDKANTIEKAITIENAKYKREC